MYFGFFYLRAFPFVFCFLVCTWPWQTQQGQGISYSQGTNSPSPHHPLPCPGCGIPWGSLEFLGIPGAGMPLSEAGGLPSKRCFLAGLTEFVGGWKSISARCWAPPHLSVLSFFCKPTGKGHCVTPGVLPGCWGSRNLGAHVVFVFLLELAEC